MNRHFGLGLFPIFTESMSFLPKQCCCCSLELGMVILIIFSLVGNIYTLVEMNPVNNHSGIFIVKIVYYALCILLALTGCVGIFRRSTRWFLPFTVWHSAIVLPVSVVAIFLIAFNVGGDMVQLCIDQAKALQERMHEPPKSDQEWMEMCRAQMKMWNVLDIGTAVAAVVVNALTAWFVLGYYTELRRHRQTRGEKSPLLYQAVPQHGDL